MVKMSRVFPWVADPGGSVAYHWPSSGWKVLGTVSQGLYILRLWKPSKNKTMHFETYGVIHHTASLQSSSYREVSPREQMWLGKARVVKAWGMAIPFWGKSVRRQWSFLKEVLALEVT
jgi:hypothetical protein